MVLGEGGFGTVYKGWLEEKPSSRSGSGSVIAVKKLNSESLQGVEEWQVNLQNSERQYGIFMFNNDSDAIFPVVFWIVLPCCYLFT